MDLLQSIGISLGMSVASCVSFLVVIMVTIMISEPDSIKKVAHWFIFMSVMFWFTGCVFLTVWSFLAVFKIVALFSGKILLALFVSCLAMLIVGWNAAQKNR